MMEYTGDSNIDSHWDGPERTENELAEHLLDEIEYWEAVRDRPDVQAAHLLRLHDFLYGPNRDRMAASLLEKVRRHMSAEGQVPPDSLPPA